MSERRVSAGVCAAVALAAVSGAALLTACGVGSTAGASHAAPSKVKPLALRAAAIPPLRVRKYETRGTYPRASGDAEIDLRRVNAALREAVVADERGYAQTVRGARAALHNGLPGRYRMRFDPEYASASTGVVSALLPVTRELFPGQHGGDGWLGVTVSVPSGRRIAITDLFTNAPAGVRALAAAWRSELGGAANICVRLYPARYAPTVANYSHFALLPGGIAVATQEVETCYRFVAVLPYDVIRRDLSPLGARLVDAVRVPR